MATLALLEAPELAFGPTAAGDAMSRGWEALMLCRAFRSLPGMLLACGGAMVYSMSRYGSDEMSGREGAQVG